MFQLPLKARRVVLWIAVCAAPVLLVVLILLAADDHKLWPYLLIMAAMGIYAIFLLRKLPKD